ncbi:HK97 family phage prohead protease [Rothia sp. LK2588]|uniref:HK97 family phage prohead protease n=1 Tax=Rothia sp. LK2588 TaxID=3114369 RepID=UPI0034CF35E4
MAFTTKAFDVAIQGAGDGELQDGQFKALISTYNPDSYGDVVAPGAFKNTIAAWEARGDQIPVIWAHDWNDPFSHIGVVQKAEETGDGLVVTGYISPEERDSNPKAAQIWRLMKSRRVTQFSFAFDVIEGGTIDRDGKSYYELRELKVYEVGPCLLGVNQESELLAAKAQRLERENLGPAARKSLQAAWETIGQILDVTPQSEEDHPAEQDAGGDMTGVDEAANPAEGPASDPETNPATALLQRLDLDLAIAEAETETLEQEG